MSIAKPISARQLRANRRNAQRSTGPRTEAGKARAALNARVHGIFTHDLLMPGEDAAELEAFVALLLDDVAPRDFLERTIAMQYVEAKWRIRRVRRAERETHGMFAGNLEAYDGRAFLDLRQRLRELPRIENLRPGDVDPRVKGDAAANERIREQRYADRRALVPVEVTMADSVWDGRDGPFERLGRYEHRLELSADRALRQLHRLRKERGPDWMPPEEEDLTDDATDAQNEPISEASPPSPAPADACEQRSCNIEPVRVTKLPSPRGMGVPPEHWASERSSGEAPEPRREV